MKAASLFSGIGAPEAAMPHWQWAWCAETERFASAVLKARHPDTINLGDVTAHDFVERAAAVARPDVIVFGSPCQSFSVAGRRLGLDDPRGNLALVAMGIVARLEPRWFVFENVPGLLSSDDGRDFAAFLGAVDECGYTGAWASLDAQWFGVAQRRERVFFVGHSGDWRYPAAVLAEPESLCGHHPPRREKGERPARTISARTEGGGGLGTDFDCDGGLIAFGGNNTAGALDEPAPTVSSKWAKGTGGYAGAEHYNLVAHSLRADGFDASEDGTGRGTPLVAFDTTQITSKANRSQPQAGDPCHPIPAHGHAPAIASFQQNSMSGRGTLGYDADTSTLRPIKPQSDHQMLQLGSMVRRLTPRECSRLQGFPDDYLDIIYRGKPASDGPRYRALGNSMAVPVMRWILSRIEQVDAFPIDTPSEKAEIAHHPSVASADTVLSPQPCGSTMR